MGEIKGFVKYKRQRVKHRPVEQRIKDFAEFELPLTPDQVRQQAARCMDCGTPFCNGFGCPLRNNVPDINELVYKGRMQEACRLLHSSNNFPEITGRLCPAPCEAACTLSINDESVSIRKLELEVVEQGFANGWIKPLPAVEKTGRRIALRDWPPLSNWPGPATVLLSSRKMTNQAGFCATAFQTSNLKNRL
jgi:glutamate synthase (NADPH/NADH) small chain